MSDATATQVLVIGLGNDILTDDAVGLLVARELRERIQDHEGIAVAETEEMGLSLLDLVVGYRDLVLVDAIQTGQQPPGFIHEVDEQTMRTVPAISPHFVGVGEALALGRTLGMAIPERVRIIAVEVEDRFTMGTRLTPALEAALPGVVERVLSVARALAAEARAG